MCLQNVNLVKTMTFYFVILETNKQTNKQKQTCILSEIVLLDKQI